MTTDQAKRLIATDSDFCYTKRYNYSVTELKRRYPDGVPDRIAAAVLLLTESDLEYIYERIVVKLRNIMGVEP